MSANTAHWRPIEEGDISAIHQLGSVVHPDHLDESQEAFVSRLAAGPETCHVLASGKTIYGYALAHPWDDSVSPLGAVIEPRDGDVLFLHDLVVSPVARGRGHACNAVRLLKSWACLHGKRMQLVSVNRTYPFWTKHGFVLAGRLDEVASYGADALLMAWDPGTACRSEEGR